jgi:hypothetical protein
MGGITLMKKIADMASAIHSLAPGSEWIYEDENYETIVWLSDEIQKPTYEQVVEEISRLQEEIDSEIAAENQKKIDSHAARQSAIGKLAAFGLTEEEIKAIIGV